MSELYTRCSMCAGTCLLNAPHLASPCLCTRSATPGWSPVGVTTAWLDRHAELERALAGDPGVPPDRRIRLLERLLERVQQALKREGVEA